MFIGKLLRPKISPLAMVCETFANDFYFSFDRENKHEFLNLPLDKLDKFNISSKYREKLRPDSTGEEVKGRAFT